MCNFSSTIFDIFWSCLISPSREIPLMALCQLFPCRTNQKKLMKRVPRSTVWVWSVFGQEFFFLRQVRWENEKTLGRILSEISGKRKNVKTEPARVGTAGRWPLLLQVFFFTKRKHHMRQQKLNFFQSSRTSIQSVSEFLLKPVRIPSI